MIQLENGQNLEVEFLLDHFFSELNPFDEAILQSATEGASGLLGLYQPMISQRLKRSLAE